MSAPDPKAVEAAIEAFAPWAATFDATGGPGKHLRTLVAAARAYLRAPTAPQGAEPVDRRGLCAAKAYGGAGRCGNRVTGDAIYCWRHADTAPKAAPQDAEIARAPRVPTQAMVEAARAKIEAMPMAGFDETAERLWIAMYDAALTPTDAETK